MADPLTLELPTIESAIALSGEREINLRLITQLTGAKIVMRGQDLMISGSSNQIHRVKRLITALEPYWRDGKDGLGKNLRGDTIRTKTFRQQQYVQTIRKSDLTFGIGPAGTGKTYLAAVLAVRALLNNEYERLILTRPAVEAGEKLGFLPGDLQEKVNPYLRPLYDALHDFIEPDRITSLMERQIIEVAPIAYMRGRTLNRAFVIVDEAQNTSPAQMKMLLTRIGAKSKMVVTGDLTQTDLLPNQPSGLAAAEKILSNIEGISFCYFDRTDVVRHALVQRIVEAYESHEP